MENQHWLEHPSAAGTLVAPNGHWFKEIEDGHALAEAIVNTVREALLVLDADLRVVAASRSYCSIFKIDRQDVQGRPLRELDDGLWNIPELRVQLEKIALENSTIEAFEVRHKFADTGWRTMLLNARRVFYARSSNTTILLAIEDVTERRDIEQRLRDLVKDKEMLLLEMQHRVGNSLQIIASILLLKAREVVSEETRLYLEGAHQRVLSIAAVQKHLVPAGQGAPIEVDAYLVKLCETLADSLIGGTGSVRLTVNAQAGKATSRQIANIGLIVTELVMNSLKHANFIESKDPQIVVAYEVAGKDWKLSISDNGAGNFELDAGIARQGLGTSIVQSLSKQLDAKVEISSGSRGTTVTIAHAPVSVERPHGEENAPIQ
jgi:chemotaxis protein methyltransferase CheR